MGHKARAKEIVAAAGVPVLPSALGRARGARATPWPAAAAVVGFPLLVKASAGGGGRGMRLVERAGGSGRGGGLGPAGGRRGLRVGRGVPGALPGHAAARRGAGDRRQRRHRAPPLRPRVLGAAAPPEGGGGGSGAARARCGPPGHVGRRRQGRGRRRLRGGGDRRVPGRRGRLLLPRDEHPPPGRARRHRAGDRARPGRAPARWWRPGNRFPWPRRTSSRRVTRSRSGSARNGPARTTGRPPARSPTSPGPTAPGSGSIGASSRGARSAPPTIRWWPRSWRTDGTGPRLSPACPSPCAASSSTVSRPTGTCSRPCSTTGPTATGAVDVHYLERRRTCVMPRLPDAVRHRHGAAAAAALLAERAAHSLVPVPAAGWRNVGEALHADTLTDAVGPLQVRASRPGQPVRVLVDGQWEVVGHRSAVRRRLGARRRSISTTVDDGLRRRYRVRHGEHAASRERPGGAVDLRPAHAGRRRRARRGGRRVPRPAARRRHQGAGVAATRSWRRVTGWSCWRR